MLLTALHGAPSTFSAAGLCFPVIVCRRPTWATKRTLFGRPLCWSVGRDAFLSGAGLHGIFLFRQGTVLAFALDDCVVGGRSCRPRSPSGPERRRTQQEPQRPATSSRHCAARSFAFLLPFPVDRETFTSNHQWYAESLARFSHWLPEHRYNCPRGVMRPPSILPAPCPAWFRADRLAGRALATFLPVSRHSRLTA